MEAQVTIAQAIRELRAQLAEAAMEGKGTAISFVPRTVEVELGITFNVEAEVGGSFKLLSLVTLSGKARMADESIHKVKLTLEPVSRDGEPVVIRDSSRERK
jgi:hypothetical protein